MITEDKITEIFCMADGFQQDFAIIDNKKELYASVSDAKRVINGLQPKYEVM